MVKDKRTYINMYCENGNEAIEIMENSEFLYSIELNAVEYMIRENLKSHTIMKIILNDKTADFHIIITSENLSEILNNILAYYLKSEEYEECERIFKLIEISEIESRKEMKKPQKNRRPTT